MESEIVPWITGALNRLGFPAAPLPTDEAQQIVKNAREVFVAGNPRAWWLSLQCKPEVRSSEGCRLESLLPVTAGSHWFIPETETNELPVYSLSGKEIEAVLGECPFFEYYIVDKRDDWLLAESDHNEFYLARRH